MTNKKKSKDHKIKWYWNKIQYGLFIYGLTNRLQRIGIEIKPYYWEREFSKQCDEPKIKGNNLDYSIKNFGPEEIKIICAKGYVYNVKEKLERLKNGQICLGLVHDGDIAAFSWIELNELNFRKESIKWKENQAYLGGMYTVESFRGLNLAAYLRYQISIFLKEKGRNEIYSISDYFNYPAIKFKKKLDANHVDLHLYINLFGKYEWNIKLKKYS